MKEKLDEHSIDWWAPTRQVYESEMKHIYICEYMRICIQGARVFQRQNES